MSLQGPIIIVSETGAADVHAALSANNAFPLIDATWADAATAFVSIKPSAVVIADPGPPRSEASARMLCLQVATSAGALVPVIARTIEGHDAAVPIALPASDALPAAHLLARLQSALRVRALHATVLRRIESYGSQHGKLPALPVGDALEDATVMIVGRGGFYPALSEAMGRRLSVIGALTAETATKHLASRDIDGIVIGEGFNPRAVEGFLAQLAQEDRFRAMPVAVTGNVSPGLAAMLPNIDVVPADAGRIMARMIAPVRQHAFARRLKRMLHTLDSDGIFDAQTGLLTPQHFWHELKKLIDDAGRSSEALSLGRFSFEGSVVSRTADDAARMLTRLTRESDFACRDDDGSILVAFAQTDLRDAHLIARRTAAVLRQNMTGPDRSVAANVTLAALKPNDTLDSLMMRVHGGAVVAAE
jgi:hypothetical protein